MSVNVTKLPSGLTVVTETMPHLETAALGVWAGVGGRDETAAQHPVRYAARATGSAASATALNVTPTSRAASLSAATAPASSVAVCDAITVSRSRELPTGTVGGRIAIA